MTTIEDIYQGAHLLIADFLRKESSDQGHYLTGALEDSLDRSITKSGRTRTMEGFAVNYAKFVNEGVPAESASMAQFPYLVRYFQQRGLPEKEAKGAAAATIKTWMKEGMSTQASKRFSKTGSRQNMVENAFVGNADKIDEYMTNSFDFWVDEEYHKEKSETI